MNHPIVQAIITFIGGAAVSALNAFLSARVLKKKPTAYASFSSVRQILNVAYLAAVFFIARAVGGDMTAMLLGAAFGLTGFSMLFALKLAEYNSKLSKSSDAEEKGDEQQNG